MLLFVVVVNKSFCFLGSFSTFLLLTDSAVETFWSFEPDTCASAIDTVHYRENVRIVTNEKVH